MKRAGFLGPQYIMGHNRVITPKKMKETWVLMVPRMVWLKVW